MGTVKADIEELKDLFGDEFEDFGCGHCNSRCPFGVKQQERMQEIREYFGK